ncbi:MAG: C-terminal target protein, partial [Paenibacillus sp.]|nr:C-terminal target protein [Paenibacillus sp.]
IYMFRQISGGEGSGVQPYSKAEIMPHLADNGRNYGLKVVKDINGDGLKEIVMLNDGVSYHIGVYTSDNQGALSIVGDQYFGYTAKANPDDGVPGRYAPGRIPEFYVQSNPVTDMNNDGQDEMIYSVFTSLPGETTGNWKIYAADPLNYDSANWKFTDIATIDGYYLKGITHMLGADKPPVLLMSQETTLAPSATSDLELWTFDNNQFSKLASMDEAGLVTMAQHTPLHISDGSRNGERKPYLVDINKDGKEELFISRSGRYEAITINEVGEISVVSAINGDLGAPIANFTDADGNIVFLTSSSGEMNAVSQSGQSLWTMTFGGYLTVGTTIGDIDGDSLNEIIFTDKGKVFAYRMVNDQFEYLWDTPGTGKNANGGPSAVSLADMNGDGVLDIVSKSTDRDGSPVIQVLNGYGDVMWDVTMKVDTKGNTLGTVSITDYVVGDMNGDGTPDIVFSLSPGYPNGRTGIIDGALKELAFITPVEWLAVYPPEYDKNYNVMRSIYPTPGHYSMADVDKNGKMEGYFIGLETAYRLKHIPATMQGVSAEELIIYNVTGSFSGSYSRPLTLIDGQSTSLSNGKTYYYWKGASNTSEFVIEFAQIDNVSRLETYGTANEAMSVYANVYGSWEKVKDVSADAFESGTDRHVIDFNGYVATDKLKVVITGATTEDLPVVSEIKVYGQQPETFRLDSYVGTIESGNLPVYYNSNVFADVDMDGQLDNVMTGGFNAFTVFKDDLFRGYMTTPLTWNMWHVLMPPLSYNPDMTVNTRGDSDLINYRRQQGIADVDGDGKLEIALQYITGKSNLYRGFMYCYSGEGKDWADGTPQSGYFRFDQKDSNVQWTYDMKPLFGDNVMVYNITSADIDGDGLAEFIATTNTGYVIAFNGEDNPVDGRIAWSIQVGTGTDLQMPSIGDIDNDGYSEIIVPASDGYLHVIDGKANAPTINSFTADTTSQQPGTTQLVMLTVNTTNMANNTPVSVELISSDGAPLSPAVTANGTIRDNQAVIPFIVPSSVPAGSYLFKVTAKSATYNSAEYTISTSAQAATQAVSFYNGTTTKYSQADLIANGEIITDGILFIPASFSYQTNNGVAIHYSAAQGIYIGANITTKASSSDIMLRSSMGPIVIDHATFVTSTGSNDISMLAGTYISAQGTSFETKNSGTTSLTANESIDLSSASIDTGQVHLSAYNDTTSMITTNTNFHGGTPSKIANGGTAVTNP